MLHYGTGKPYGVAHVPQSGYGACITAIAPHERSIHFVVSFMVEYRTAAGIEQGAVFQRNDGCGHCINRRPALFQYCITCIQRIVQPLFVPFLFFFVQQVAGNGSCSPVYSNCVHLIL